MPAGLRVAAPLNSTSIIASPRRLLALCSPRTHLKASTTLLLPHPLGPTMPVTGVSKTNSVRSAKLLKPWTTSLRSRIPMGSAGCVVIGGRSSVTPGAGHWLASGGPAAGARAAGGSGTRDGYGRAGRPGPGRPVGPGRTSGGGAGPGRSGPAESTGLVAGRAAAAVLAADQLGRVDRQADDRRRLAEDERRRQAGRVGQGERGRVVGPAAGRAGHLLVADQRLDDGDHVGVAQVELGGRVGRVAVAAEASDELGQVRRAVEADHVLAVGAAVADVQRLPSAVVAIMSRLSSSVWKISGRSSPTSRCRTRPAGARPAGWRRPAACRRRRRGGGRRGRRPGRTAPCRRRGPSG